VVAGARCFESEAGCSFGPGSDSARPYEVRRKRDFYETAPWQVDALVDFLPELRGSVWCPSVGDGSLLRRLRERRPDLGPFLTSDIDPARPADFHGDATSADHWRRLVCAAGRPDWVIDNFPFNVEIDILPHAYIAARLGVVAMARVSFPEGTKATQHQGTPCTARGPWLAAHPRIKQIVLERHSFTGNGKSDNATTEWLVWAKPGVAITSPGGHTAFGYKPRTSGRGGVSNASPKHSPANVTRIRYPLRGGNGVTDG
jgi:hypothetical protein